MLLPGGVQLGVQLLGIEQNVFMANGTSVAAVSYTHLDVYKRQEQAQVESVSDSDTNKTIAGMPWQDLVLLFLETGSVALGLIMIGLLAKFRPKPRAWINTKKENKQKGEK